MSQPRFILAAIFLACAFLPGLALAAEPENPAIRAAIEKFIDAQDISGAVTVVATKEKFLAVDTIGLADIAKKKPMRARYPFLGSLYDQTIHRGFHSHVAGRRKAETK